MVSSTLVKKKKRRIITAIIGAASGVALTVFIIIAFLGQYVGSFTVAVNTHDKAAITLYDNKAFQNGTTYLRVGDLPEMTVYPAASFVEHGKIDNTDYDHTYGGYRDKDGNLRFMYFIKYSFYLKNTGPCDVRYTMTIKVTENIKPSNVTYDLLDLARVRVYENVDENVHEYETYAKKSLNQRIDDKGNPTYNKPVSGELGEEGYCGFAQPFLDNETLISFERSDFFTSEYRRYTIVVWLDEKDEYCKGPRPQDCSLRLAVEIAAYEYGKQK